MVCSLLQDGLLLQGMSKGFAIICCWLMIHSGDDFRDLKGSERSEPVVTINKCKVIEQLVFKVRGEYFSCRLWFYQSSEQEVN